MCDRSPDPKDRGDAAFLFLSFFDFARVGFFLPSFLSAFLVSHGITLELDLVSIMHETIQDGVRHRGIPDQVVPGTGRELAGDQRRARAVPVIEDLQEVPVLRGL